MKAFIWLLLFAIILQAPADAGHKDNKAACASVKKKIRAIESRMRDGYSAAQGIRYDARLRELRQQRYKLCRK